MSDNLSILLVLKDRAKYTKRFLNYLNYIRFPYPIIIADGGRDQEIKSLLSNKSNFKNLNYEYHHYGYDKTLDNFHEKMSLAVDKINTPLVCVMDNDDFVLQEGLEKSIKFLKENHEYNSTRGSIQLIDISENIHGRLNVGGNIYGKHLQSIDSDSPLERLDMQNRYFHSNWHNVTKSSHIRACWKMIDVLKPSNMRFTGQMVDYVSIILGKSSRFTYPWILHQQADRVEIEGKVLCSHFPTQAEWIKSPHWVENFNKMAEITAACASEAHDIPVTDAIESFYESYTFKLPHLKNLLKKEVAKCREMGYNKERVEKLRLTVSECDIQNIQQIECSLFPSFSAKEELQILKDFLINFRA